MGWKPGESGNPAGRPKGSKDKFTHQKADFMEAFEKLGGVEGMVTWIQEDEAARRRYFYDWIVRLMPRDISIESEMRHSASQYSTEELLEELKAAGKAA